jgi:hypothetical protein
LAVVPHARPSARQGRRNNRAGTHRGSARFADLPDNEPEADLFERLRAAESIGRPLGNDRFLTRIERSTGRDLKPGKRGPKPADGKGAKERGR